MRNNNKFTFVNGCFQHKRNEEIGVFWQALTKKFIFADLIKKQIMSFVEELTWRGMIHDIMPGTDEQMEKEMISAYVGIDPTADSLHIGHLVGVMMLKHLQIAGHKPLALVGGATGMIGDPSGKSEERNLLDEATLRKNEEGLKTTSTYSSIKSSEEIPRVFLSRKTS